MRHRARVAFRFAIGFLVVTLYAGVAAGSPIVAGFNQTTFPANDDGSTGPISLGFSADFFGNTYSQLYVNNNGNVTFGQILSTYTPFGLTTNTAIPIIAPFFADVDTANGGNPVTYGTGTVGGHAAFGVNWLGVAGYGLSSSLSDTFQLLLVDRSDTGAGNFDIYFNYGSIQWDTGTASGGQSARAGYSNGSGSPGTYLELAGSGLTGAFLDGGPDALMTATNDGVPGQFLFQVRSGAIQPVPEPAPLALLGLATTFLVERRRSSRSRRVPPVRVAPLA